jgi:hypothetical protein
MNIAAINTEIEILKIKIAYRRKLIILQNLRNEDADDESEFYVSIGRKTLSVFRKRTQSFSANIFFSQRFKTNLPFIYREINLKNYNNYIEEYSLYFKNYARAFFTEFEKITHTVIFTEGISRNK